MRNTTIDNTIKVEYPDEISFCFNPTIININSFSGECIQLLITSDTGDSFTEKRELFNESCFFDISSYLQGSFDYLDFNTVDYSSFSAIDSKTSKLFTVVINFYLNGNMINSFSFSTLAIWGAMQVGERYNGDRTLTYFKNYPFTIGMYSATSGDMYIYIDSVQQSVVELSGRKVWNISLNSINALSEIKLSLPASTDYASVWDNTFDFTFKGLLNVASNVICHVDDSTSGIYLRWINRHGFYCYWLFKKGDESKQIGNDGEFMRNNMADYNYKNGYHGGTGRKQRKIEDNILNACAPLIDSDTYDFLSQLASSPVVDMYAGIDDNGVHQWKAVNISVATFIKSKKILQDFAISIILPETRLQYL